MKKFYRFFVTVIFSIIMYAPMMMVLELWLTIGMVATLLEKWLHYWNGGYTIGMVATLLERWLHY